ncbi:MAG: nitrous oxide-stimulated promoter family protein [Lancefieldella sp.]
MYVMSKSGEKAVASRSRSNQSPAKVANSRVGAKRDREKKVVSLMISLYCHKKHVGFRKGVHRQMGAPTLCAECAELDRYARQQIDRCPFMETKTFCSNCRVHCYTPEMREKIKEVMRFSGPRMLFHHPIMALRHVIESKKEKKQRI